MALEHAILGFLDYGAMSGYDLKKVFDDSVNHFWTAQQSQIYRALKKMVEDGWVEVEVVEQDDRPDRKVHHITGAGRAELERWLASPLPPPVVRSEWLVRVFFAARLGDEQVRALFERRAETMRLALQRLECETQGVVEGAAEHLGTPRDRALWQVTLDYGIAYTRWEVEMAETMLERLKDLPKRD